MLIAEISYNAQTWGACIWGLASAEVWLYCTNRCRGSTVPGVEQWWFAACSCADDIGWWTRRCCRRCQAQQWGDWGRPQRWISVVVTCSRQRAAVRSVCLILQLCHWRLLANRSTSRLLAWSCTRCTCRLTSRRPSAQCNASIMYASVMARQHDEINNIYGRHNTHLQEQCKHSTKSVKAFK